MYLLNQICSCITHTEALVDPYTLQKMWKGPETNPIMY